MRPIVTDGEAKSIGLSVGRSVTVASQFFLSLFNFLLFQRLGLGLDNT